MGVKIPDRAYYKPDWNNYRFGPEGYLDLSNYEYRLDGVTRSFFQSVLYLQTKRNMNGKDAIAHCRNMVKSHLQELTK